MNNEFERAVFFISDGTGITAETLGYTLLSQFQSFNYRQMTIPFVDTREKAMAAVETINASSTSEDFRPLIFSSIVNPTIQTIIAQSRGKYFDLFQAFIPAIEEELGIISHQMVGLTHSMKNVQSYNSRIDAVNFGLSCDDGIGIQHYSSSELILLGVSRCGKTPTSLYLALHFGLFIANFPFTDEDFPLNRLPEYIQPYKAKCVGLTIQPGRLQHIRQERRPNSRYSSIDQCCYEISEVEKLYRREAIPFINTTNHSIEEISAKILSKTGLRRKSY
jgi:[pyruvate, water dikinase]-phosphate phosphotransferase / [pyruvate, water dikinase] kinase